MSREHQRDSFEYGGRSFSISHRPSASYSSPVVISGLDVHQETADLANIGVVADLFDDDADSADEYVLSFPPIPIENDSYKSDYPYPVTSVTPLIDPTKLAPFSGAKEVSPNDLEQGYGTGNNLGGHHLGGHNLGGHHLAGDTSSSGHVQQKTETNLKKNPIVKGFSYLPAVFLGTLLNVLDALSYGMIMFPIGEAVFSQMAPTGLSMFYISTVISQLVYSCGGSAFKAGIGSEMIEVTPFFHSMALSISAEMSSQSQEAILATVIVTYALSSVVTGVIFYILGKLKLGSLVGFFPRHILVGCIGGVGYFLIVTGIEVSSRLEGGLMYNWETFSYLFGNWTTFGEWIIPLVLTVILIFLHQKIHHSLLVPIYFICVFLAFHFIVAFCPSLSLEGARDAGWVFPAVESNEPWYSHYQLFRFQLVDWFAIARQFPSMLALTFFGILHVPINVPALAVTLGMDEFDVDRELVAHGYSNAISGFVGSIQNYLVYTNSVLFIRAGADDRLAGILLAIATTGVMVTGPVVIGYIPVCVVGSLIFLLGYELVKEALYDTCGRLKAIEYTTVIIIVVVMGAWDFVYGVLAGILLACLSFVVEAAKRPAVRDVYTGVVARSTVLRHRKQLEFLKDVGNQIYVVKLQGTVFFGSIGGVERKIRDIFEKKAFNNNPVKYLIVDMRSVFSIDFSAAEGFRRILNLTNDFGTQLIISSVVEDDEIVVSLRDAGLWDVPCEHEIQLFNTLNSALEWCENSFLKTYNSIQIGKHSIGLKLQFSNQLASSGRSLLGTSPMRNSPMRSSISHNFDLAFGTPRTTQVLQAASKTARDEQKIKRKYFSDVDKPFKIQPLPLLMLTFSGLSDKDELFWSKLANYFIMEKIPEGIEFYNSSVHGPSFFIMESGLVKSTRKFEGNNREIEASILPNTAFGDLTAVGENQSTAYSTVHATVAWRLTEKKIAEMVKATDGQALYNELLLVQTELTRERFYSLTANLIISA